MSGGLLASKLLLSWNSTPSPSSQMSLDIPWKGIINWIFFFSPQHADTTDHILDLSQNQVGDVTETFPEGVRNRILQYHCRQEWQSWESGFLSLHILVMMLLLAQETKKPLQMSKNNYFCNKEISFPAADNFSVEGDRNVITSVIYLYFRVFLVSAFLPLWESPLNGKASGGFGGPHYNNICILFQEVLGPSAIFQWKKEVQTVNFVSVGCSW